MRKINDRVDVDSKVGVASPASNSTYGGPEDYLAIVQLVVNIIHCRESVMDEVVPVNERLVCAHAYSFNEKGSTATRTLLRPDTLGDEGSDGWVKIEN